MFITPASNIKYGSNPPYKLVDFYNFYPQFADKVPEIVAQSFLDYANCCLQYRRYHGQWKICMSLFIAHFLTLYLETLAGGENSSADDVISSAQAHGIITSESAGSVSYSQDTGTITNDLDGWAQWKLTSYGIQFASIAKLLGKGGMLIW